MTKAIREAKRRTSWTDPDPDYEAAVLGLADRVLDDAGLAASVEDFVASIAGDALANSLGAKLVQLTMPGVPDVYQGCELAGLSLVDPDNRRDVDFARRRSLLAALDSGGATSAGSRRRRDLDAAKLLVTVADAAAAARPPGLVRRELRAAGRGRPGRRRTSWPSPRRQRGHGGDPAARRPAPPGRLGRTPRSRFPRRAGWMCLPASATRRPGAARRADAAAAGGAAGSGGTVTVFSVWAPAAGQVEVEVAGRRHPMEPGDRAGWWRAAAEAPAGHRLRLPARRRRAAGRPQVAAAAVRPGRAEPDIRPRRLRVDRRPAGAGRRCRGR